MARLRRAASTGLSRRLAADEFFDRLVGETRKQQARFAMTPQLVAGLTGRISPRRLYRLSYAGLSSCAPHRSADAGSAGRPSSRGDAYAGRSALDDYIAEETGHEEWILDDIAAAGGDRAQAAPARRPPPHRRWSSMPTTTSAPAIRRRSSAWCLCSKAPASPWPTTRRRRRPANAWPAEQAFRYLNSHGALDQEHMIFFETDEPDRRPRRPGRDHRRWRSDMFRLFGGLFAAIELEETRDAA